MNHLSQTTRFWIDETPWPGFYEQEQHPLIAMAEQMRISLARDAAIAAAAKAYSLTFAGFYRIAKSTAPSDRDGILANVMAQKKNRPAPPGTIPLRSCNFRRHR